MKAYYFLLIFFLLTMPLFAQIEQARIAPGAESRLAELLNKPGHVSPVIGTMLERGWFNVEMDTHVFTDQANLRQVAAVLLDKENYHTIFDGRRTKLRASIVSRGSNEIIADFTSIASVPVVRDFRATYRASVRTLENTNTRFANVTRQLPDDSETNDGMKNLISIRFAEEVTINGKTYTYIRAYSINDVSVPRLNNIKNAVERNSGNANEEMLQMIIDAAIKR